MTSIRGDIFLFPVVWVAISSASILVVLSNEPGEVCAFWRLFLSSLILLPLWIQAKKHVKIHHVASGIALSLHFILWMRSLFLIPVYTSTLLVVVYPLYSLVIDILVYKYRPSLIQLLGLAGGVTSLTLFLGVNRLALSQGAVLSLLAGLSVTLYFELGRYARGVVKESLVEYAFPTYMSATVFTALYNIVSGSRILPSSHLSYLYFILMALIPMMLGHTLMNYLLKHYPVYLVTSVSLGEPFGAGLLAYMVLGQGISLYNLATGLLTITSLIAIIRGYR
ncbi:DMT family transporter [Desulfurococcus amylolyticus]|uniref:EamA-like transporter family n=1 Tax=Desulfurococcus amylolyticus DSM 16532 TaxID=768672 RepID=I3XR86_DESAM|nr:DMT family transporter [Desulfurococcus amylolyticus]AFL66460.1 EamA-like transporter family [Desulfurococcus amylolyticus DSM 16532]